MSLSESSTYAEVKAEYRATGAYLSSADPVALAKRFHVALVYLISYTTDEVAEGANKTRETANLQMYERQLAAVTRYLADAGVIATPRSASDLLPVRVLSPTGVRA